MCGNKKCVIIGIVLVQGKRKHGETILSPSMHKQIVYITNQEEYNMSVSLRGIGI